MSHVSSLGEYTEPSEPDLYKSGGQHPPPRHQPPDLNFQTAINLIRSATALVSGRPSVTDVSFNKSNRRPLAIQKVRIVFTSFTAVIAIGAFHEPKRDIVGPLRSRRTKSASRR
ncbi:hypothetical protein EVAR_62178_1 [Eumeta japonica]|uniref:Uncharacterized protein n=1 Tax=Eumeta variegata TaxID=151549 RepID=A0A4C1ZV99_EUMVA|nr:hypothetical protein EVAR_62178_1 [Eumeta japonica]